MHTNSLARTLAKVSLIVAALFVAASASAATAARNDRQEVTRDFDKTVQFSYSCGELSSTRHCLKSIDGDIRKTRLESFLVSANPGRAPIHIDVDVDTLLSRRGTALRRLRAAVRWYADRQAQRRNFVTGHCSIPSVRSLHDVVHQATDQPIAEQMLVHNLCNRTMLERFRQIRQANPEGLTEVNAPSRFATSESTATNEVKGVSSSR